MHSLYLKRLMLLTSIFLLTLSSCTKQPRETLLTPSVEASATPLSRVEQPSSVEQRSPASTGNLLSPGQVAKLTKLPIPIVAPTYVPKGFRLISADGASVKYANGGDDTGYSIAYEGEDGTCFAIASSKDSPRKLKQIGEVESVVGAVKMYEETYEGRSSIQSFIPVKGNPVMISPVWQLNSATGSHEFCKALNRAEYERILKSMELVK